jgi:hypothetical protein
MVVGRPGIVNISCGICSDERCLLLGTAFHLDATEAMRILREKNWLYHEYCVPDSKRWGLIFADPERLKTLAWRGHLAIFDAKLKLIAIHCDRQWIVTSSVNIFKNVLPYLFVEREKLIPPVDTIKCKWD